MWHLLYARKKLKATQQRGLKCAFEDWPFTCGTQLQDLELPGELGEVYIHVGNRLKSCTTVRSTTPYVFTVPCPSRLVLPAV